MRPHLPGDRLEDVGKTPVWARRPIPPFRSGAMRWLFVLRLEAQGGQAMMRLRRASVIAMLSLFAWAATASAECAWVLWHQNHHMPADQSDSGLFMQSAYDSY